MIPPLEARVVIPVTTNSSSIVTSPPAESIVRFPVEVSISLLPVTPIWILSIVAPPLASIAPVNVETPVTLSVADMFTSSSSVYPSTSRFAFISTSEAKVDTPETFKSSSSV